MDLLILQLRRLQVAVFWDQALELQLIHLVTFGLAVLVGEIMYRVVVR